MQDPGKFHVDAMLCDSVVVADGKIFIQGGGWNMIAGTQFPMQHGRIGLGILITVPFTETNKQHKMEISLHHGDEQLSLGPMQPPQGAAGIPKPGVFGAGFNIGRPPFLAPGDSQIVPFAVNLDGYSFAEPGAYSWRIDIDEVEYAVLPFRVVSQNQQTLIV